MGTDAIIGYITGGSFLIFVILLIVFISHTSKTGTKTAETEIKKVEKQNNKSNEGDKNRKELVEQYGEIEVLIAEYKQSLDQHAHGKTYGSLELYCIAEKDKQEKRDAQIKYIKSLSKEDLELYLLQEEAIKQIYKKYE